MEGMEKDAGEWRRYIGRREMQGNGRYIGRREMSFLPPDVSRAEEMSRANVRGKLKSKHPQAQAGLDSNSYCIFIRK